jgi:hypothetical protein
MANLGDLRKIVYKTIESEVSITEDNVKQIKLLSFNDSDFAARVYLIISVKEILPEPLEDPLITFKTHTYRFTLEINGLGNYSLRNISLSSGAPTKPGIEFSVTGSSFYLRINNIIENLNFKTVKARTEILYGSVSDLTIQVNSQTLTFVSLGDFIEGGNVIISDDIVANTVTIKSTVGVGSSILVTDDTQGNSPIITLPLMESKLATIDLEEDLENKTINKLRITTPTNEATLTILDQKILTVDNTLELKGTDESEIEFGTGGTVAYTENKLDVFADTTADDLRAIIKDGANADTTGTEKLVFAKSPTLTTSLLTDSTTFGLLDTTATEINAFGAATTLNLGYDGTATSTTNISIGAVGSAGKTINIGTGSSASLSSTTVNIGTLFTPSAQASSTVYLNGKVGIGVNSFPLNKLHINLSGNDGDNGILIARDDSTTTTDEILGGIGFDSTDGNAPSSVLEASAYIAAFAAEDHSIGDKGGYLTFGTAPIDQDDDTISVERMRITSEGNVGINVTNPTARLDVSSGSSGNSTTLNISNNSFGSSIGIYSRAKHSNSSGSDESFGLITNGYASLSSWGLAVTKGPDDGSNNGLTSDHLRFAGTRNNIGQSRHIQIVPASLSGTRTYTLPDVGANASFVMTESSQTINGNLTLGGSGLTLAGSSSPGVALGAITRNGSDLWFGDGTTFRRITPIILEYSGNSWSRLGISLGRKFLIIPTRATATTVNIHFSVASNTTVGVSGLSTSLTQSVSSLYPVYIEYLGPEEDPFGGIFGQNFLINGTVRTVSTTNGTSISIWAGATTIYNTTPVEYKVYRLM